MMLQLDQVRFGYEEQAPAVADVSLTVAPGEIVALIGGNGSGKSTVGRLAAGALLPDAGTVRVDGFDAHDVGARDEVRRRVGLIMQNPVDQIVSTVVADEVAFGPQNLGVRGDELRRRVRTALAAVGLADYEDRDVNALSGGEQQRLAIAGVLAMEPSYLVLDEAFSMVDSAERPALRRLMRHVVAKRNMGLLTITHDPLEALAATRVVVLEAGRTVWDGTPDELVGGERARLQGLLLESGYTRGLTAAFDAGYRLASGVEPEAVAAWLAGVGAAARRAVERALASERAAGASCDDVPALLRAEGVAAGYDARPVLRGADVALKAGRVALLAGASGSGKSTLATVLAGLREPQEGAVALVQPDEAPCGSHERPVAPGDVALAFQHPEGQLFLDSVEAELRFGPEHLGCAADEVERRAAHAAEALGIDASLLARDPFSLSGGQARRAALAAVLALDAPVVILDEPTAGLDAASRRRLHAVVRGLAREGRAVLVISHDLEEWLEVADELLLMEGGGVRTVLDGRPDRLEEAFARAGLAVPEAWRLRALMSAPPAGEGPVAEMFGEGAAGHASRGAEKLSEGPQREQRDLVPEEPRGRLDARVKIILLLVGIAGVFMTGNLAVLALWAVAAVALALRAGMGARALLRAVRPAAVLMAIIMVVNLVSCDGTADVALAGTWGLSIAGGLRAAVAVARIALMLVLSLMVTATTTPVAVADAVVRLGAPLARWGVPVEELGMVLSLALRFIPLVTEEVHRVELAQRSRGVQFDEGGLVARIQVWKTVLVPVMVGLFRRADRLGAAMDARCYHESRRAPRDPRPLARLDRLALAGGLAGIAALVAVSYLCS